MQNLIMEQNEILLFVDVDGTLYDLEDGFTNSWLGQQINGYTKDLSQSFGISIEKVVKSQLGSSQFLANALGCHRSEVLDYIWSQAQFPEKGLQGQGQEFIQRCLELNYEIQFLTGAGRPWATKVLRSMNCPKALIQNLISAETFPSGGKIEAMQRIAQGRNPESIWSIGDQKRSDIEPAKKLGLNTYHVTQQNPLMGVLDQIRTNINN
jgi:phosphoglycolate phosphatase-like HAD superfamily hydrolase